MNDTGVRVRDSAGLEQDAPLFFVSPSQVNFLVPARATPGPATVKLASGSTLKATGSVRIERVAPALFAADSTGSGVAAALIARRAPDGSTAVTPVFSCEARPCSAVPLDVSAGEPVLILFGTGIRNFSPDLLAVRINGANAPVLFAGAQGEFPGLDQVNVQLTPALSGAGLVSVTLTIGKIEANAVTLRFQ